MTPTKRMIFVRPNTQSNSVLRQEMLVELGSLTPRIANMIPREWSPLTRACIASSLNS